jgi:hypothetical protein
MGVLIVSAFPRISHILLLLILLAFPKGLPGNLITVHVWLCLHSIINPPFHPPSVCPSKDCPPFIYLIQKPTYGSPTLHLFSTQLAPSLASHLALGHPFLYLHTYPNLFFIHLVIVQNLCFQHLHSFLLLPLATFFFRQSNPSHPSFGHFSPPTRIDIIHKPWASHSPYTSDLWVCPLCHASSTN